MSEFGTFSYIDGSSAIDMNTSWSRDDVDRRSSFTRVVPREEATIWDDLRVAGKAVGVRETIDSVRYGSSAGLQEPIDNLGIRPIHGVLLFLGCLLFLVL